MIRAIMLMLALSALQMSCSSGEGGTGGNSVVSPTASAGFTETYTASATAGEILTYTIDTQSKTYSYQILHSAYGLSNVPNSGTLVLNPDGSYSPSDAPTTKVYALQNGLLVGTITLNLGNGSRIVPILGISQPVSSQAALTGIYNYVGIQCAAQTFGDYTNCGSSHGTVQVDNAGNYIACQSGNIANGPQNCSPASTGTFGLLGNGVWGANRTGSTAVNYVLAYTALNGQNVLVLDLNDPGGYGYGFIVMSTQTGYVQNLIDGTWYFQTNQTNQPNVETAGSLVVAGTNISSSFGHTVSANFDLPWTGLASISGGVSLLAGTGAYAYVNPGWPGYLELGIKR